MMSANTMGAWILINVLLVAVTLSYAIIVDQQEQSVTYTAQKSPAKTNYRQVAFLREYNPIDQQNLDYEDQHVPKLAIPLNYNYQVTSKANAHKDDYHLINYRASHPSQAGPNFDNQASSAAHPISYLEQLPAITNGAKPIPESVRHLDIDNIYGSDSFKISYQNAYNDYMNMKDDEYTDNGKSDNTEYQDINAYTYGGHGGGGGGSGHGKKKKEVHYHSHKHLHEHDHAQNHLHKHNQEHQHGHDHGHSHHSSHSHQHTGKHFHGHKSSSSHTHNGYHKHSHDEHHGHQHEGKHSHKHNGNDQHYHSDHHSHGHKHHSEHGHNHHQSHHHSHDHGHEHEGKHSHKHSSNHKHSHEHKNSHHGGGKH